MKTLLIDCQAGISGDMLLAALRELVKKTGNKVQMPALKCCEEHGHLGHCAHHGRSHNEVKKIINESNASANAKEIALNVYAAIAKAEAQVHEKTPETVHFHEVGRNRAIENALGIGAVLESLEIENILISPIYDGTGFVDCAHGRIPVPVPAVQAMKEQCPDFEFRTAEEVKTEMVTPSGLAALIGIGAKPATPGFCGEGNPEHSVQVQGTRDTGRGGLKVLLYRDSHRV